MFCLYDTDFKMVFGKEFVLLICLLFAYQVSGRDVLKCMACEKAPHLANCEEIELCDPDSQVCFVEEAIDIGGQTVINAGCRYKEQCDSVGCFGETSERKKRSYTGQVDHNKSNIGDAGREMTCHHCCAGDFCNMYGCPDTFNVDQLLGGRCFSCEHVRRPEECNTIVNCEEGYICGQETVALGTEKLYNLGCINKRKCDILRMIHSNTGARKKRNLVTLWNDCCDYHLCNGYSPMLQEPPMLYSPDYTCPRRLERPTTDTVKEGVTTETTKPSVKLDSNPTPHHESLESAKLGASTEPSHEHSLPSAETPTTNNKSYKESTTVTNAALVLCHDKSTLCSLYGKERICKRDGMLEWTKMNCAKYCDICGISVEFLSDEITNSGSTVKGFASSAWCFVAFLYLVILVSKST